MCHGNGQQILRNIFPVVQRLIVGVRPVKIKVLVKLAIRAGIGKVNRFVRFHSNKYLHQRK
ncbi:hypothetical protein SDC9_106515 [bioreactor metagenome]|uniref:Uncharacterized protein n=1 Tax=bioreactor metagenome TaxID=1076179 RepID=A0A645B2M9_9ZZZZ